MSLEKHFLETMRVEEGQIPLLPFHLERLWHTQKDFYNFINKDIQKKISKIELPKQGVHKMRMIYNSDIISYELSPYKTHPVLSLKIFHVDFDYQYKYLNRAEIISFQKHLQIHQIPLFVKNGYVTDTSIHNIALSKNQQWYTPTFPLLKGTRRSQLLKTHQIKEKEIQKTDILNFDRIKLFNAMIPFSEAPDLAISSIQF